MLLCYYGNFRFGSILTCSLAPHVFGEYQTNETEKRNNLILILLDFLGGNPGYILNKPGFDLVIHRGSLTSHRPKKTRWRPCQVSMFLRGTFCFIVHVSMPI